MQDRLNVQNTDVTKIWYSGMPVQNGIDGKQTRYATYIELSDFDGFVKVQLKDKHGHEYITDWKISNTFAAN